MLTVIDKACEYPSDLSKAVIVLESSLTGPPFHAAFEELKAPAAREMAIAHVAKTKGVHMCLNGNNIGPYGVNAEGLPLDKVHDEKGEALPQTHARMQPKKFRIEIPLAKPLRG